MHLWERGTLKVFHHSTIHRQYNLDTICYKWNTNFWSYWVIRNKILRLQWYSTNQFVSQKYILFAGFFNLWNTELTMKKKLNENKSMTDQKSSANTNGHRYRFSPYIPLPLTVPNPNNDYSSIIYKPNFIAINHKGLKLSQILYQPIRAKCACVKVHL